MQPTVYGGDAGPSTVTAVCPFLIAATGDWRLAIPDRQHRCGAFVPLTVLALDKQARLCLTPSHLDCQTYAASLAARQARTGGDDVPLRAGRWALARTAPVIVDSGGVRSRILGAASDRRRWPAIPAVLLVATVLAVGISGMRGESPAVAAATPRTSIVVSTPAPTVDLPLTLPPATPAATAVPTVAPTARPTARPTAPAPTYRTKYTVRSGDTLSKIASSFKTTVSAIADLNNITDPARLKVGQVLLIP